MKKIDAMEHGNFTYLKKINGASRTTNRVKKTESFMTDVRQSKMDSILGRSLMEL